MKHRTAATIYWLWVFLAGMVLGTILGWNLNERFWS